MSIIVYQPEGTAYTSLLQAALAKRGVDVRPLPLPITTNWLVGNTGPNVILHHHWPSYNFTLESREETAYLMNLFIWRLRLARRLGYSIVWTAHNLYPHEPKHLDLQRQARQAIVSESDAIISLCRNASRTLVEHFGPDAHSVVIPHGHFIGHYGRRRPSTISSRRALGFTESCYIYLAFGKIREYKGFETLASVFSRSAPRDCRLIIAGEPADEAIASRLSEHAKDDNRIRLHLQFVERDMIPTLFSASDAVVLTYRAILSSGVAMLALSMGRPVVVPKLGCLSELVTEACGLTYDPTDRSGLANALLAVRGLNQARTRRAARWRAREFSWDQIAESTMAVYSRVARNKVGLSKPSPCPPLPNWQKEVDPLEVERTLSEFFSNINHRWGDDLKPLDPLSIRLTGHISGTWTVCFRERIAVRSEAEEHADNMICLSAVNFFLLTRGDISFAMIYLAGHVRLIGKNESIYSALQALGFLP